MMIRGFGRNEHGSRRLEDFDADDNEVDETMVRALCLLNASLYNSLFFSLSLSHTHIHSYTVYLDKDLTSNRAW